MANDNIPQFPLGRFKAVAIGASTGGPGYVEQIIAGLPADLPFPIFIAQHLPPHFTATFAAQLDHAGPLTAVQAEDGMPVFPGTVYVGMGHQHMRLRRNLGKVSIEISPQPTELLYKPSADELLRSCAAIYGRNTLAVVMSGIGQDGALGALAVRSAGGVILTQSEHTCAVYGMPKACVINGLSDAQLDPDDIRRAILQLSPEYGPTAAV